MATGNKGRFSDRLKTIRYNRMLRKKSIPNNSEIMYKNFLKVMAVIPLVVMDNVFDKPKSNKQKQIIVDGKTYILNNETGKKEEITVYEKNALKKKIVNRDKIKNINIEDIKKNQKKSVYDKNIKVSLNKNDKNLDLSLPKDKEDKSFNMLDRKEDRELPKEIIKLNNPIIKGISEPVFNKGEEVLSQEKKVINTNDKEEPIKKIDNEYAKKLEKKIIDLIQKDLLKMVNELEIYESELYILSEINKDEKTLEECKKNIAEVKKILAKIEKIKHKYDYLKDNYDFEYLLELGDNELTDKIIELKNIFNNNEIRATVDDYKLLDVYKYLYLKLDDFHDKATKIEQDKEKQEEKLIDRDIDFNKLKGKVFDVNRAYEYYAYFAEEQNKLMQEMADDIAKIDKTEIVDYQMKGFGKYLMGTARFLGLLALNPLRGIFPAIATETRLAHNAVRNLRKGIIWEENRKMVYDAVDYNEVLNSSIDSIESNERLLDETLDNLFKIKLEYNNKFRQYQGDFSEYKNVIDKINGIQNNLINNKIKMEIIRQRAILYKKENENKLKLVRTLNQNEVK